MKHLSTLIGLLAAAYIAASSPQQAEAESSAGSPAAAIAPASFKAIGKLDPGFQSYNVEMAEVIGGRFWKPYANLTPEQRAAQLRSRSEPSPPPTQIIREGQGVDGVPLQGDSGDHRRDMSALMEKREAIDLSNPRLRMLAAALAPAYVRVSGSWANSVYFQDDDAPVGEPPSGFTGVLTRDQWRGVVEFAQAVNAGIVTSFAYSSGTRDANGNWLPGEAQKLLDFTRSMGGSIHSAELVNEPNLGFVKAPQLAHDVATLRAMLAVTAPDVKIIGPGGTITNNLQMPGAPTNADYINAEPNPRFDIYSYHYYGGTSQRCNPPDEPRTGVRKELALSEEWLERSTITYQAEKKVRDEFLPGAPIWVTEAAQAACGGSPWAATFLDTFRYVDQMANLAKQGMGVIFHNTLAASDYALLDEDTFEPRPSYWAALLWRRIMGDVVLDTGLNPPGLRVYAHCLRDRPGGVALLAINADPDTARTLELTLPAEQLTLGADTLDGKEVKLNGAILQLGKDDQLPALAVVKHAAGTISLAPATVTFLAMPTAGNSACQ